jgi:hypothetical protein
VFTTLHCLGVNLGGWGVDGVIGLDLLLGKTYIAHSVTHRVLEDHAFAIDYEAGVIRFGSTKPLHFSVPAEGDLSQIVVNASIEGKPLRLALDTGSQVTSLFRRSEKRWIPRLPVTGIMNVFHILGRSRARSVLIRDFALGDEHWPALNALLSDARNPSVDGLLAVSSLKLKTLQFESDRKILSWER